MQRSSPCALGRRASTSAAGSSAASVRHAQARKSTCDRAPHAQGNGLSGLCSGLRAASGNSAAGMQPMQVRTPAPMVQGVTVLLRV